MSSFTIVPALRCRVEPVDPERQFRGALCRVVPRVPAPLSLNQIDHRFDDDIVGGGQALPLEAVGEEHRDRAVAAGAG